MILTENELFWYNVAAKESKGVISMLTQDRHSEILSILKKQGSVTVARLTQVLGISESTIRRDLT